MVDFMATLEEKCLKTLESSSNSECGLYDQCEFYLKAATSYKLAKSWDQAGLTYVKVAESHLKMDSKHEVAATAYVEAAHCYKRISPLKATSCLQQAVELFSYTSRLSLAARSCKELGELYEQLRDFNKAILYYQRASKLFHGEEACAATSVSQCKQKVAQLSALLQDYTTAIEIYEEIAREAASSNLLRYGVRGHLLNAGLCRLCSGDLTEVTNALEQYQEFDATFSRTQECRLLIDLLAACDEENVEKFTEVLKEYDSLSPLGSWKTILLLRKKVNLKAKLEVYI